MSGRRRLRPSGFDELGLRRALADRMLPFLVAAMAFLAALALAGWVAAASLARGWQAGAGASLTVQVPRPDETAAGGGTRLEQVLGLLRETPGIESAHALSEKELSALLEPWLGKTGDLAALPLPAVVAVHLADPDLADPDPANPDPALKQVTDRLTAAVPGTLVEQEGVWASRLAVLGRSLQACAAATLLIVAAVAVAVIAVATRGGLAARREAIEIVHGLGATDGYIAGRFAARATLLAGTGGLAGGLLALPVLLWLAQLAAPFSTPSGGGPDGQFIGVPIGLWMLLPGLPLIAALIGLLTAHGTVRRWLRRLP
ncbi:MAG: cell division protein FtsX [Acetobacteraceae bacterium]